MNEEDKKNYKVINIITGDEDEVIFRGKY